MHHYRLPKSPSVPAAVVAFRDEVERWALHCREIYAGTPPTGSWDQTLYLSGWMPVLALKPTHPLPSWAREVRDNVARHCRQQGRWQHGYWRRMEVDRGMAHFERFLGALWRLDPRDTVTAAQFLDAAEHLFTPTEQATAWFDDETGLFRSVLLGTGELGAAPGGLNLPAHFHGVNLALLAFRMGGGPRYLEVASLHGCHWADAILSGKSLPLALSPSGPVFQVTAALSQTRSLLADVPGGDCPVARAEAFLAAGAVGALLTLWQLREDQSFLYAAERLIEILLPELADPEAGALAAAIRQYRNLTGCTRFDRAVLHAVEDGFPYWIETLAVDASLFRQKRPAGVGKRVDLPFWFEDGMPRQHNPILLGLAAEIAGNARLATRALDLALGYFRLARLAFPDGREQGFSARSVYAVAAGHGRDAGAGMVTEVLRPLMGWE
ncbi:MAG: hypothetical protein Q7Q73_09635 [Verrucomicrobiota bacterium JB024]|nr:hypothetical protein [Verrucomicrobiota bacterium JB024]